MMEDGISCLPSFLYCIKTKISFLISYMRILSDDFKIMRGGE